MNERIQELIDQSRDLIQTKVMLGGQVYVPGPLMPGDVNLEKFAKLIVQECAELIDNKVTITAAQTYDEVFVAKYDTKELCAQQIKEHFGVE